MFINYLKIALRNLVRQKGYSVINILGLAISLSCATLIFLYVQDELSYDRFHKKTGRIYRIVTDATLNGKSEITPLNPGPTAEQMAEDYPEIKDFCRMQRTGEQTMVRFGDKKFYEDHVYLTDSSFFSIFSFDVVAGDARNALNKPWTAVITEEMAKKYFGNQNPIGKTLLVSNQYNHTITAVVKNPPHNSHLQFDALISYESIVELVGRDALKNAWGNLATYSYIETGENFNREQFERKLPQFSKKYVEPIMSKFGVSFNFFLQRIEDIHLNSGYQWEMAPGGNRSYIYIFSVVAVFLLIIAAINYMNLATARATRRAREVGIRKVLGADRKNLILQFLSEALVISAIAMFISAALVEVFLPGFNSLSGKKLSFDLTANMPLLGALLGVTAFVGFIAGSYPALYLSGFQPARVLKGNFSQRSARLSLRKGLVIVQFTIAIAMIICTWIATSQLHYLKSHDLGYNKEHVLVINVEDTLVSNSLPVIKAQMLQNPDITAIGASNAIPGKFISKQIARAELGHELKDVVFQILFVDFDFLDMMQIRLSDGRKFSQDMGMDYKQAFIVNETGAKKLGIPALGKRFQWGLKKDGTAVRDGKVVGVIKDIHLQSLHNAVEPLVIMPATKIPEGYLLARISGKNIPETISYVQSIWSKTFPNHVFNYSFLDETFDAQYRTEEDMSTALGYFALITIFIACLGLFGLASYTTQQRVKEIGIRKVVGATIPNILLLLSKEFTLLVFVSILLASPVAWFGMSKWLEDFAYRVSMGPGVFIMTGLLALFIAIATVSYQAIRASLTDPVHSLRYE